MEELLGSQFAVAWATSKAIEWLKDKPWFPFTNVDNAKLNRCFAILAAAAASLGIHGTFDVATGTATITGLTVQGVVHGGMAFIQQFALQQLSYKMLVKKP